MLTSFDVSLVLIVLWGEKSSLLICRQVTCFFSCIISSILYFLSKVLDYNIWVWIKDPRQDVLHMQVEMAYTYNYTENLQLRTIDYNIRSISTATARFRLKTAYSKNPPEPRILYRFLSGIDTWVEIRVSSTFSCFHYIIVLLVHFQR